MRGEETAMNDPFNLQRFLDAQEEDYACAIRELREGRKQTHWMWYIFPQIAGLGHSSTARRYAIASREEADAYLRHPLLGPRLIHCTELVNAVEGRTIHEILGSPDDVKFRSCMTLFARVADGDSVFRRALTKYFAGEEDGLTLERLNR